MATQYTLLGWINPNITGASVPITPTGTDPDAWNALETLPTGVSGALYWIGWDLTSPTTSLSIQFGLRPSGSTAGFILYNFNIDPVTDPQEVGFYLPCEAGDGGVVEYYNKSSVQSPTRILRLASFPVSTPGSSVDGNISIGNTVGLTSSAIITNTVPSVISITKELNILPLVIKKSFIIVSEDITCSDDTLSYTLQVPIISDNLVCFSNNQESYIANYTVNDVFTLNILSDALALVKIIDTLFLADSPVIAGIFYTILLDLFKTLDTTTLSFPIKLSEHITNLDELSAKKESIESILSLLNTNSNIINNINGFSILLDNFQILDLTYISVIENLIDDIILNFSNILYTRYNNIEVEDIQILKNSLSILLQYLVIQNFFEINDLHISTQLSHNEIVDTIDMEPIIDIGNTNYLAWVMNPENYAISNYTAPYTESTIFNNNYYFGNTDGLHILNDNKLDDGNIIEVLITTAALDFNSQSIKQVPKVFLGSNGTDLVLKISIDNKQTVYYELNSTFDGLNTKQIKVGKGLLGKNWQFSLIHTDNDDFKLDNFEFFPINFKRKH